MREINWIDLHITTRCNYSCKECCRNFKKHKYDNWFVSKEYIVEAAKYFYGIKYLHIMGGEPSLHPDFATIVPNLKGLFNCEHLLITTNGYGFRKYPESFRYFTQTNVTHYTEKSQDNSDAIKYMQENYPEVPLNVIPPAHISLERKGTKVCERGIGGSIAYIDGLLYPCCVGDGMDGAKGIKLTDNWKQEIQTVEMPCNGCFFAED